MTPLPAALALVAGAALAGCGPSASEDWEGPTESPAPTFRGKPSDRLVGTWREATGRSTLVFGPGDSLRMKTKTNTPGGAVDSDQKGRYGVEGDRLSTEAGGKVVEYAWKREGDGLTLKAGRIAETKYALVR